MFSDATSQNNLETLSLRLGLHGEKGVPLVAMPYPGVLQKMQGEKEYVPIVGTKEPKQTELPRNNPPVKQAG